MYEVDGDVYYNIGMYFGGKLRISNQHFNCDILRWRPIHELLDDGEKE